MIKLLQLSFNLGKGFGIFLNVRNLYRLYRLPNDLNDILQVCKIVRKKTSIYISACYCKPTLHIFSYIYIYTCCMCNIIVEQFLHIFLCLLKFPIRQVSTHRPLFVESCSTDDWKRIEPESLSLRLFRH